jgi:uncharacterized damage-inducible protein DinB
MGETFEQYTARILGYARGKNVRRILRSTPGSLAKLTAGMPRRKLMIPPAPGKWTVGQILGHLSETEMLWGYRVRMILETDGVELLGMDQDTWAKNSRYDQIDPKRSLDTFRAIRAANLELFARLSPREINRRGRHSQFGELTIKKIMSLMAGHDINHSRQVSAILRRR